MAKLFVPSMKANPGGSSEQIFYMYSFGKFQKYILLLMKGPHEKKFNEERSRKTELMPCLWRKNESDSNGPHEGLFFRKL